MTSVRWIEEPSLVFECVLRTLQSIVATEDDPLAILVLALLFHNLDKSELCKHTLTRVEDRLHDLPNDITDSGLQIQDCLLASGYLYVTKVIKKDPISVEHIILPRIKFAAEQEWFHDSSLAVIVALCAEQLDVGPLAKRYLREGINHWLEREYVLEVCHYCLIEDEPRRTGAGSFLIDRDWSNDDLTTLTWGLLGLEQLCKKGYKADQTQYTVAQHILRNLDNCGLVQAVVDGCGAVQALAECARTTFDLAFAEFALNVVRYDRVFAVTRSQKQSLDSLLQLGQILAQGGRVVQRWQVILGEVSFVLVIVSILAVIFSWIGWSSLLAIAGEVLFLLLIAAFIIWLWGRGLPSEAVISTLNDVAPPKEN